MATWQAPKEPRVGWPGEGALWLAGGGGKEIATWHHNNFIPRLYPQAAAGGWWLCLCCVACHTQVPRHTWWDFSLCAHSQKAVRDASCPSQGHLMWAPAHIAVTWESGWHQRKQVWTGCRSHSAKLNHPRPVGLVMYIYEGAGPQKQQNETVFHII